MSAGLHGRIRQQGTEKRDRLEWLALCGQKELRWLTVHVEIAAHPGDVRERARIGYSVALAQYIDRPPALVGDANARVASERLEGRPGGKVVPGADIHPWESQMVGHHAPDYGKRIVDDDVRP